MSYKRSTRTSGTKNVRVRNTSTTNSNCGSTQSYSVRSGRTTNTSTTKDVRLKSGKMKTYNYNIETYTSPDGTVDRKVWSSAKRTKKNKKQSASDNALSITLTVLLVVGAAIYYAVNYLLEVVGSFVSSF